MNMQYATIIANNFDCGSLPLLVAKLKRDDGETFFKEQISLLGCLYEGDNFARFTDDWCDIGHGTSGTEHMGLTQCTEDKLLVLSVRGYRLDNAGDDNKFWAYVYLTSAIAHRAPIVETLWTLVPWYHEWDKICKMFGCNMAVKHLGYTKAEAEEVYKKRTPPGPTHITSATITTCIRRPDGEPYWSFTVEDLMCTGRNSTYMQCAREVISRAIAGGTAPPAIATRLEALLPVANRYPIGYCAAAECLANWNRTGFAGYFCLIADFVSQTPLRQCRVCASKPQRFHSIARLNRVFGTKSLDDCPVICLTCRRHGHDESSFMHPHRIPALPPPSD